MRKEPDWSVRGRKNKPAAGLSGLEHPAGRSRGPEHPGQSGAQPQDRLVRVSRPSATDWNIRGQEAATQQRGPLDWSIREEGVARGQAQGARTGTSGEEFTGRQQGHPDWSIRGAETLDWNIRGRSGWPWNGASGAALRKEEVTAAAREAGEQGQGMESRGGERRRRTWSVMWTGTSRAGQEQAAKRQSRAPRTGASGGPRRKEDKRKDPELDHQGTKEQTGSRAQSVRGCARRRHEQEEQAAKKKRSRARNGTQGEAGGEGEQ